MQWVRKSNRIGEKSGLTLRPDARRVEARPAFFRFSEMLTVADPPQFVRNRSSFGTAGLRLESSSLEPSWFVMDQQRQFTAFCGPLFSRACWSFFAVIVKASCCADQSLRISSNARWRSSSATWWFPRCKDFCGCQFVDLHTAGVDGLLGLEPVLEVSTSSTRRGKFSIQGICIRCDAVGRGGVFGCLGVLVRVLVHSLGQDARSQGVARCVCLGAKS